MARRPTATRPSAALERAYWAKLDKLTAEMNASIIYWLTAKYKAVLPLATDGEFGPALDASPAMELRAAIRRLARRWQAKYDDAAPALAKWFASSVTDRSTRQLGETLRDVGFSVRFKPTRAMNEAYQAVVGENVALIKSIPEQYLKNVEGAVMRSVQTGRALGELVNELTANYGVTRRRAAFIARSQNQQATAVMTRVRQKEAGITKARWLHSAGGKEPRPEHVAFSGKTYDIDKGAYLEGKWTWPGVEINCRCVSIPVVPGFDS